MTEIWYNYTSRNLIKSSQVLLAPGYQFSARVRGANTMSDHIPTQQQTQEIPYGYCHCGCGQLTVISKRTDTRVGRRRGVALRFIHGHTRGFNQSREQALWRHCVPGDEDDCWEWTGNTGELGYGKLSCFGEHYSAHRLSYELHFGSIPVGLWVLHKCDNPPCCNPKHLFLGTAKDNADDRTKKGRGKSVFLDGEGHPNAKLTFGQASEILSLKSSGLLPREVAPRYGISRRTVSHIWQRESWKCLDINCPASEVLP